MPLYVGTKKGLFIIDEGRWAIGRPHFLGDPVSAVLAQGASIYAALNLGHFGTKLHASDDAGAHWTEVAAPSYPEQPADAKGPAWKLVQVWSLEAAGATVWAGTLPGGLFRSGDCGSSWTLVRSLWDQPERAEWFGGGYDVPGLHSICLHPARESDLLASVSCGGVWHSADGAATWSLRRRGCAPTYMPPEQPTTADIQDPHRIVRCDAKPEVLWCQHHNGIWRSVDEGAAVERGDFSVGVELRLRGGGASERPANRLVRAGREGRMPRADRRRAGGAAHP